MFFAPGDKVSRGLAGVIVKRLYLFSWGVRDLLALRKDGGDYGRCPLDLQKREGSALLSHYLTAGFETSLEFKSTLVLPISYAHPPLSHEDK